MLKVQRIVTIVLAVLTVGLFMIFFIYDRKTTDTTYPEIKVDGDIIEVSVNATEEEYLKGVTAYDGKDGDITDKVVVESVSPFLEDNLCQITYAVCDSDKHVVKNKRSVKYIDYVKPKFTMNRSLVYSVNEDVSILEAVGAIDVFDGDISEKVLITATDYETDTPGVFTITLQATNTMGDIVYIDLPLYIEDVNNSAPVVHLKEYIMYVKKGEKPDFLENIEKVTTIGGQKIEYEVSVKSDFDREKPGVYSVHYYVTNPLGHERHSVLTVVVEE